MVRFYLLILLGLPALLFAAQDSEESGRYSTRIGFGYSDANDLGEILSGHWNKFDGHTSARTLDGGYRLVKDTFGAPIDIYLKGGIAYFDENDFQESFYELIFYVKAYLKLDFLGNRVRLGVGEGLSLAQEIPIVESIDADGAPTAKFLNYLDISLDFDTGRLLHVDSMKDLYLGYTLKHRSGVFGLFNGVHGGSNYNMLTLEKNF